MFFIHTLDEIMQPPTRSSHHHKPAGVLFPEKIEHVLQDLARQHKQDARFLLIVLVFKTVLVAFSFTGHQHKIGTRLS
jgi:hypothetical protein